MMKLNVWIVVAGCMLAFGCTSDNKTATAPSTPSDTSAGQSPSTPVVKQAAKSTLTKLKIEDVKIGDGTVLGIKIKSNPSVAAGDIVSCEYTGKLADGTVFDTNVPGGKGATDQPLVVIVGRTPVIPGWTQGLMGMKVGGERKLGIPPSLGYGDQQVANIPPNSDLFFDIKVLDIVKRGEEGLYDLVDVTKGTGPAAKMGDTVTVQYTGTFSNGVVFDSNTGKDKAPIADKLGSGMALSGFEAGLVGIQKGGVRKLRLPPAIAYATKKVEGIPPNSTLFFTVKALEVSK